MQNDPEQWKDPDLFIPERFDFSSDWSKTKDGKKRSPHAYSPFMGGTRVCLGKTFAEIMLKFTIPLYYHFFDIELVKPEHKKDRPKVIFAASKPIEIPMILTTRNKVVLPATANPATEWKR